MVIFQSLAFSGLEAAKNRRAEPDQEAESAVGVGGK